MTRSHALAASFAVSAFLAGGCFDHAVPAGRDVVARTPAEAESLRDSVTFLDFHEAGLSAFPEGLGAYPKLRRLSVQGQKAAAAVPASIAEAKGLEELDLIATGVKDLPPEAAALPTLRRLYLSDNGLASLPAAVCGMKGLVYLNLDRNALTNLPDAVGDLAALKWVRLNGNKLADLPDSAANWKDVRRLYLRGNGLKAVPAAILEMKSLEQIDLGENDLTEIPAALFELPKLHYVQLDGNARLASLPGTVTNMPQLTHLFLHRTALGTNEQARLRAAYPNPVVPHFSF
ncbi:MAG: leucine-rich repeat domain-containing protein [Kiritimatiellae bacterium]|nr:leucine-rich repeat domain-containing protein [Kiritimatiellia bacterium]